MNPGNETREKSAAKEPRWELQLFHVHIDALYAKFPLPVGWEPVHYERDDGNRWFVMARKPVKP